MERESRTPTDGVHGSDRPQGPDRHDDPIDGGQDWTRRYEQRPPPRRRPGLDPSALFVLLDGLRRLVPRELEGQLTNLIREFLLTLRSLIDWYLEHLDGPPPEPRVEDIPIE
jgi:hypothetical protein